MKKAVFFDIDGTLLDSMHGKKEMTEKVTEAIHKLQQEGHYAFIATGRPYAFMSTYLKEFGFDGLILSNGAQVIFKNQVIYKQPMDPQFVKALVTELDKEQVEYILEGEYYSYIKQEFETFHEFFKTMGIESKMIKRTYELSELEVFKVEVLCKNKEMARCCEQLMERYPEYEYFFSISEVLFEIHARASTKATGIEEILKQIQLPIEQSYAFGDGSNDIEMLKRVGCGIAMGNATDAVKAIANQVTASVTEDGVAKGIQAFISW